MADIKIHQACCDNTSCTCGERGERGERGRPGRPRSPRSPRSPHVQEVLSQHAWWILMSAMSRQAHRGSVERLQSARSGEHKGIALAEYNQFIGHVANATYWPLWRVPR